VPRQQTIAALLPDKRSGTEATQSILGGAMAAATIFGDSSPIFYNVEVAV
jgi:hypothetical protein